MAINQEIFRVGILGLGRSGWDIHAAAIAGHESFEVAAVADPVPERRAEAAEAFGCLAYEDPTEVIAADVDVVIVATPSHTHVPLTLAALEAGHHVVVEKPMAQSSADVEQMADAADRAGRLLTCYQPRRLDPDFLAIRDIVKSGRVGRLIMIRRASHHFMRRTDWQMLRKFDGGVLSNAVPHLLDQVLVLVDVPEDAEMLVDLRHVIGAGDAEDHAKLCLRSPSGPFVELEASYAMALGQPEWLVVGTAGAITGSSAAGLRVRWSDPNGWRGIAVDEGAAVGRKYGSDEVLEWTDETLVIEPPERSAALTYYDHLEASLRAGAPLFVTPDSVRKQIAIIQRARESNEILDMGAER